jgi:hypothetical protein
MADAGCIRNSEWHHDEQLKNDLQNVARNLSRKEILHFAAHDYPLYACSLGTLARRLAFFDIKYISRGGKHILFSGTATKSGKFSASCQHKSCII